MGHLNQVGHDPLDPPLRKDSLGEESPGSGGCVVLGKSLNLSGSWLLLCKKKINSNYSRRAEKNPWTFLVGDPVSQLQADFTLLDRGAGPRVEISCQASLGSPPITYSLVRKDGHVHMQQRPNHGQPANFSFPLTQTSDWFQCQAENNDSCPRHPPSCWLAALPPLQLSPLGCWAGLSGPGRKWCWVWGHSELLLACVNPRGPGWRAAGSAFVGQGCHQGEERTISLMHDFQVFKPYCVLSAC
nr:protein IL-40 isoform X4 [Manis javanica]